MKAQTATEFITTNMWSILLILAVLAILISMNFFKAPTPRVCNFAMNFYCNDYKIATTGFITLDVAQRTGHDIEVEGFRCTQETNVTSLNATISVNISNYDHQIIANGTNFKCLDAGGNAVNGTTGMNYAGKLYIFYRENDTKFEHLVIGSISAKYE